MQSFQRYLQSFLTCTILLMFCACSKPHSNDTVADNLKHAQLLHLSQTTEGYTLVQISNPWHPENAAAQYLLVPAEDKRWNDELSEQIETAYGPITVLRTPLQHMALTASCHAYLLQELSALDNISVMCDTSYVMASTLRQWLQTSSVVDGGSSMAPNNEVLLAAQTDVVWISPYENASTSTLSHLPLTLIYCADYMETSPLARAEWMRFYGRLVDKGHEADSLFRCIETRYDSLISVSHADTIKARRTLLAELPYGPTWYVPGGCSTSSLLYQDAGYDYLWSQDNHAGSLSLSPEAVLAKAIDCDRWIFKYMNIDGDWTLNDFLAQNPLYSQFKAAKTGEVWGCNTSYSDFFDVTPFRPDILLESLINDDERFFKRLK